MKYLMYVVLLLGIFEIFSNMVHLSKGSIVKIGQSAKRQHQELPSGIGDIHFFIKALVMLVFGLMFLTAGILFILHLDRNAVFGMVSIALFGAYGFVQAVMYRETWKVWSSAVVYNIPMVVFFFINSR